MSVEQYGPTDDVRSFGSDGAAEVRGEGAGRRCVVGGGLGWSEHAGDLIISTGKRKGHNPSLSSIYPALAEHEKRQSYPEAVTAANADFAALPAVGGISRQAASSRS